MVTCDGGLPRGQRGSSRPLVTALVTGKSAERGESGNTGFGIDFSFCYVVAPDTSCIDVAETEIYPDPYFNAARTPRS
jgi:hypothetical protein